MTAQHDPRIVAAVPTAVPIAATTSRRLGTIAVMFAAVGPPVAVIGWLGLFGGADGAFLLFLAGIALTVAAVVVAIVGLALRGRRVVFVAALLLPVGYLLLLVAAYVALRMSVQA